MSRRLPLKIASHRTLLGISLAVPLILAGALVYMGWRLMGQDRALEQQRIEERRKQATELIVTALQQKLAAAEQDLADRLCYET